MWFLSPDADVSNLLTLCNLPSKGEVEKYCRSLTIHQRDFVSFIMYGRMGVFDPPYKYACAFRDRPPSHLIPTDEERAAFAATGVGQPFQGKAKKMVVKFSQMLRDRRHLAAHIFYTPDHTHWSIFYFDQRDTLKAGNHWEHGPHVHFASSAWVSLDAGAVYKEVTKGKCRLPAVHIRWQDSREDERQLPCDPSHVGPPLF